MKVILLGAKGMVGQGVLRECLQAPDVEAVLAVGRNATGQQHPNLRDLTPIDLFDLAPVEEDSPANKASPPFSWLRLDFESARHTEPVDSRIVTP